jgi:acetoin utilization deacetylase AcuC-like enzyme
MRCSYHPDYQATPSGSFPMSKHALLKERLLAEGIIAAADIMEPEMIAIETARLVHHPDYLDKLRSASLSAAELRRLGLPWSEALWRRSRLASGGTLLAARAALADGLAGNLAGGAHHAFPDHGEGFCILNDVAIAIAQLRTEGAITRALVIDLDVHQGNGTAAIFETQPPSVEIQPPIFTFSMHGERNYPSAKMRSTLDVALPDGTGDADYLDLLARHLPPVLERSSADIAFYLAGVDVAAGDRFGKLGLTEEGIRRRDRMVIQAVRDRGVPLVIVLAGGYAPSPSRTAELHAHAFREAVAFERATKAQVAKA